jgi:hypothetical protein
MPFPISLYMFLQYCNLSVVHNSTSLGLFGVFLVMIFHKITGPYDLIISLASELVMSNCSIVQIRHAFPSLWNLERK